MMAVVYTCPSAMVCHRCPHQTFCPSWRYRPPAPGHSRQQGRPCSWLQQFLVVSNPYECHVPLLAFSKDCRAFSWTHMEHEQNFFPFPSPCLSLSLRFVVAFDPDIPSRYIKRQRACVSSMDTACSMVDWKGVRGVPFTGLR